MNNPSHLQKALRCYCFCLLCFFTHKVAAQRGDKIYMTDGSIITVKVESTNGDSVFYRTYFTSSQKILFSVSKTAIDKIVYLNGVLELYVGKVVNYAPKVKKRKTDIIYKKDGSELPVIVVSTTKDSIQYRPYFNDLDKIRFSMPKSEVYRIAYGNNVIEDISERPAEITHLIAEQIQILVMQKAHARDSIQARLNKHKNIIKVSPFTLIKNYMAFGYERNITEGQSAEVKVGIIGLNPEEYELPASGAFGSISYKLLMYPNGKSKKPRSPLHGLYLRPELAFGSYKQTYTHEIYRGSNSKPEIEEAKHQVSYQCFVFNVGKQWISGPIVFDLFMGGGIGSYNQTAGSVGITRATRFAYRMNMLTPSFQGSQKGNTNVKLKLGFYIGFNF